MAAAQAGMDLITWITTSQGCKSALSPGTMSAGPDGVACRRMLRPCQHRRRHPDSSSTTAITT